MVDLKPQALGFGFGIWGEGLPKGTDGEERGRERERARERKKLERKRATWLKSLDTFEASNDGKVSIISDLNGTVEITMRSGHLIKPQDKHRERSADDVCSTPDSNVGVV